MATSYRKEGPRVAMQKFLAFAGSNGAPPQPPRAPGPERAAAMARMGRNVELFLPTACGRFGTFVRIFPPCAQARRPRIVVGAGELADDRLTYRAAASLAERLATQVVSLPGEQSGFITQPEQFCRKAARGARAQPGRPCGLRVR